MRLKVYFFCVVVGLSLTACGTSSEDEIHQWMASERNQTKPNVKPIAAPKQFVPEPYLNGVAVEPFSNLKLAQAFKKESAQVASNGALIAPELARRKEPLEAFPLDAVSLVGSINKAGQPVALVMVDKLLYQVRVGNYLGQNYGRVTQITETEIALREVVQDAVGEWVERIATLQLQEKSK